MLGLNPMEQEVVDIPNEIARLKYCRVIYNISSFDISIVLCESDVYEANTSKLQEQSINNLS
jgi:hypothetical protein